MSRDLIFEVLQNQYPVQQVKSRLHVSYWSKVKVKKGKNPFKLTLLTSINVKVDFLLWFTTVFKRAEIQIRFLF